MKTRINENQKVTLTIGQLKKLVKEAEDDMIETDIPDWENKLASALPLPGGSGCDALGTPLSVGDWVWYVDTNAVLKIGKVIGVKKMITIALPKPRISSNAHKQWRHSRDIGMPDPYPKAEMVKLLRSPCQVLKIDDPEALANMLG